MSTNINEVKSIIRGLLTSCAEEMTVGKLRHDYRSQEGLDIPFYEFKFHDVTSFLRSIPDVCQVCDNPYGLQPIVRLVESEKSAHISSLVKRQRPSNKARHKRSNVTVHGRLSYKISHSSIKRSSKPAVHRLSHSESSQCATKPKFFCGQSFLNVFAPEFNATTSLPAQNQPACSQPVLSQTAYSPPAPLVTSWEHENEGISENYENTTPSIAPNLKDESEDCSIVELHLHQVLSNHEGVALHEVEDYLKESLSSSGHEIPLDKDKIEEILGRMVDFIIKDNRVFYINSCDENNSENGAEVTLFSNQEDTSSEVIKEDMNISFVEDDLMKVPSYPFVYSDGSDKVQRLERNLYSLIKDCPNGILLSELVEKYKLKFAAPLNLQILGCKSVNDLVSKMKYIFSSVELEDKDFKLFPAWLHNPQKVASKRINPCASRKFDIPVLIKRNIQWLMQGYPNGLHSKEFKQTYKDTFYGEIDLTEMGFSTLLEFFNALELEGIIQTCISDSDTWLLPSKSPVEATDFQDPLPLISAECEDDIRLLKEKFPSDVVGPDMNIEQEPIPFWVKRSSMIEIYVQELRNPHNFWVTFVGEECTSALEILMDDLQAFYCTKSHGYRMPSEVIRKGQICVAQYSGEWNRARVIRLVNSSEVEVLFFDYGTQSIVQENSLYFLHTSFSKLPAQAIRAMMANIAPVGAAWSKDASKRFLSLIADRPLIGIVHNVDRQNCILSLFLCDTNGDDDIYIGNVLVADGYAIEANSYEEECLGESNKNVLNVEILGGSLSREESVDTKKSAIKTTNLPSKEVKKDCFVVEDLLLQPPTETVYLENDVNHLESHSPSNLLAPVVNSSVNTSNSRSNLLPDFVVTDSVPETPKVAPPPGFCHTKKIINLTDKPDMSNTCEDSVPRNNKETDSCGVNAEILQPTSKTNTDNSMPKDMKNSSKSVNSGVNANFPTDFKGYPGNPTNYMGWTPPMYSTIPGYNPPFVPLDISARLPLNPLGYPPIPNPLDFYSLWYYEQMRQQAIIRGALAHVNTNILSQLPGLLIPPNQTVRPQLYANNQMHISELHSPPIRVEKIESVASTASTQTEDLFDDVSAQTLEENSQKIGGSTLKQESSTVIEEQLVPLHSINQFSKGLQTEIFSNTVPQIMPSEDATESACKEVNRNLFDTGNLCGISDMTPNNPTFLETKQSCVESQLYPFYNSPLDEHGMFTQYCGQLSKSENDKGYFEDKSGLVNEVSGENIFKDKLTDIICNNTEITKDKIADDSGDFEGQNIKSDVFRSGSLLTVASKEKNSTSVSKISEKKHSLKENDVKCSDIVLNPFSSSLSDFDSIRDNFQPNTEKNVFHVELNPFVNKREPSSGLKTLSNISGFSSQDKMLHCSEFESFPGNNSVLLLERQSQQNSTEMANKKSLSSNNYFDDIDNRKFYSCEKTLSEIDGFSRKNQLKITNLNEENLFINDPENNATSLELSDNFKSVSLKDSTKSTISLSDPTVPCSIRKGVPQVNKNSAMHQKQGTVEGVHEKRLPSEVSEDEVRGYQNVFKFEQETKSNVMLHKFPDSSFKRAVNKFTTSSLSNSVENSEAVDAGGSVHNASHITKNPTLSESTPTSWTTTWSTDRVTPILASKSSAKQTKTASFVHNSRKPGGNQSFDFIPLTKDDGKPRYVKTIKLLDHNIHLINMDGRPHVPTDEIVRNFTSFNGHHVVLKILDATKIEINFLELCRRRRPDIFECLDKTDMKFVSRGLHGNIIGNLHTIPLRSIPYMLKALNRDNSAITGAVQEALANFDPNDQYWKGHSS